MIKKYALVFLSIMLSFSMSFGQTPWINEIHYDNNGTDVTEGVEVAIPAGYTYNPASFRLVGYNGANGQTYTAAINIDPYVAGGTIVGSVTFVWVPISGLQNGAPDGIALAETGLIQFLSYEGNFTATNGVAIGTTSTDIGVSESSSSPVGNSLQLQGTGCQYSDFTWASSAAHTNNNINTGQTLNCVVDDVDWANVQSPPNGTIVLGNTFDVYARVWENGVTNVGSPGAGISAWIGYSSTNSDPSTWPAANWVPASFNGDFGNDDEFTADIGAAITATGTYYYASRFQLNTG
ncbi:MAG: hypothetical protein KJO77_08790, partial [Bacteroidia bacterium]|nr:hypothetical protein [Bacteroidia bacterium]